MVGRIAYVMELNTDFTVGEPEETPTTIIRSKADLDKYAKKTKVRHSQEQLFLCCLRAAAI